MRDEGRAELVKHQLTLQLLKLLGADQIAQRLWQLLEKLRAGTAARL